MIKWKQSTENFFSRSLLKFALFDKISIFCADLCQNFESMCDHIVEKFWHKDAKKGNFNLETAIRDGKVVQDFDAESHRAGDTHSQMVKGSPALCDYGSKDCINWLSPIAVSRFNKQMEFRKRSSDFDLFYWAVDDRSSARAFTSAKIQFFKLFGYKFDKICIVTERVSS